MSVLENAFASARKSRVRVVLPEMEDARVAEAARRLKREGLAEPVGCVAPTDAQLSALIDGRGVKEGIARRMLSRPMFRAAAMVMAGEADAMVAGAITPTRRVIEAASIVFGPAEGVQSASSFFVMLFPDGREMIWADCGVTVAPDALQLADIARASAASASTLFGAARVALLSFSTGTSGTGDTVDLVREVAEMTGFAGPLQADAALNPAISARKGAGSGPGHGDANVLIFPDLNAGNIAYKLAQELAGAQAIGPLLQGFSKPVADLSRGASVDDIIAATVLTLARA